MSGPPVGAGRSTGPTPAGTLPCVRQGAAGGTGEHSTFFAIDAAADGTPPTLDELEKAYIIRLLDHAGGNRTQVARLLGVSYPTVAKKIQDYGIPMDKTR